MSIADDLMLPEHWQDEALCTQVGPAAFFPIEGKRFNPKQAKRVCGQCPITDECLEQALAQPEEQDGVWGGTTKRERRIINSERQVAA